VQYLQTQNSRRVRQKKELDIADAKRRIEIIATKLGINQLEDYYKMHTKNIIGAGGSRNSARFLCPCQAPL
jgi:hypothetical protein